jgi:hypothetical protein
MAAVSSHMPFVSSTVADQRITGAKVGINLIDYHTFSSPVVQSVSNDDKSPLFSIRKVYKNLFVLSLAFVLLFIATEGMVTLQSSLNTKHNVGVNSLIINSVCAIVSTHYLIVKRTFDASLSLSV